MPITRRSLTFGMPLAAAVGSVTRHARGADTSPIVDQINAAGGVQDRNIEMVTRDTLQAATAEPDLPRRLEHACFGEGVPSVINA